MNEALGNLCNSVYTNIGAWEGLKVYVGANMTGFWRFFPSKTGKYRFLPVFPGFSRVDREKQVLDVQNWTLLFTPVN